MKIENMNNSTSARVFLITAIFVTLIAISSQQRGVDCRRFVFAPICRGVAAKRSEIGGIPRLVHRQQILRAPENMDDSNGQNNDEDISFDTSNNSEESTPIERMQFLRNRVSRNKKVIRQRLHSNERMYPKTSQQEYEY